MDLIYADKNAVAKGVLTNYSLDMEASVKAENCTFEIKQSIDNSVLAVGMIIYIPFTEWGGVVDKIKVDTKAKAVYATGRTWRGIIGGKTGDAVTCPTDYSWMQSMWMNMFINNFGLNGLFWHDGNTNIPSNFKMHLEPQQSVYEAFISALSKAGKKMIIYYDEVYKEAIIGIRNYVAYENASELDSDRFEFVIQKGVPEVSKIIAYSYKVPDAVGYTPNIAWRICHSDGTIDQNVGEMTSACLTELSYVDDKSTTEAEMIAEVERRFKEDIKNSSSLSIKALDLSADIGDKITAHDRVTGITMTQYVTKKILNIDNGIERYSYEVGETI